MNKEGVGCSTWRSGVSPGLPLILYESGDKTPLRPPSLLCSSPRTMGGICLAMGLWGTSGVGVLISILVLMAAKVGDFLPQGEGRHA